MAAPKRYFTLALFFLGLYLGGRWLESRTQLTVLGRVATAALPRQLGPWTAEEALEAVPTPDGREATVETAFQGPEGWRARVNITYSRNWRAIYPPEFCLRAAGWQVQREFTLALTPAGGQPSQARALIISQGAQLLGGLYLYVDRTHFSDSWVSFFWPMICHPQEARALVAVYMENSRQQFPGEALCDKAREFATALLPFVQRSLEASPGRGAPPR